MADIIFTAKFVASKVGKDGIAVTWDIDRVTRSTGAVLALVTAGATNVVYGRRGRYGYRLTGADLTIYDYLATAITADATVDAQELDAVWTLWSLSWHDILTTALTAVGSIGALFVSTLDAAISSRGTADPGDAMALTAGALSDVDTELSGTHGAGSWEGGGGAPTVEEIRAEMDDNSTQLAAIRAKTDAIGTGSAFIAAPVLPSGNVNMVVGDVYKAADGRSFDWTYPTWNIAIGSVVVVIIQNIVVFTATRISATAVRLELTSIQSSTVKPGRHTFYIREIQADAEPISILTGTWVASAEPAPMP